MNRRKLNNKGFAVSAILYTLLTAFLLFLGASLAQFSSAAKILGSANKDLTNGFAYNVAVYYDVNDGVLESTSSYKLNNKFLIDGNVYQKFYQLSKGQWTLFATTNFSHINNYGYPVVSIPYVPLDNSTVENTIKLKKTGYRFVGWGNPTVRWMYIEKSISGEPIYGEEKNDYETINNANLLDYSRKNPPDKEVNALQVIYTAKWDVDIHVRKIYSGSCSGGIEEQDTGGVKYKYEEKSYSLYGNIKDKDKIDFSFVNDTGTKTMYYYDYSNGDQDINNGKTFTNIVERDLEIFIEKKNEATGIVIVIDKRATNECP